ncbi:branched-chain amino acid permease [Orrella marina]|uniref:Branched-chain amino acid permease n=2 Tax=Orrella marina TaxID=2163011 RepID=A0A2R4XN65_9BURK|nr:branched-chain amino acid permease [Orrella marina]
MLSLPVAMGYIPLGMVFGFLFVQAGAAWWLAVVASLVVYAGASQFAMIPMLAAGLPLASLAVAALVINMRHMFYGLSLLKDRPQNFFLRWYLVFALTDETYSVITASRPRPAANQMAFLAGINQGWWTLGTITGAGLGAQLPVSLSGLDFALAALFAILTAEQWRVSRSLVPVGTALVAYGVCSLLLPTHALLASVLACVIAGLLAPSIAKRIR